MADYQVTNYGLCGECRHHKYICDRDHSYAGFTTEEWICDNPKSVSYGKLMPYTGGCTCWEQRDENSEVELGVLAYDYDEVDAMPFLNIVRCKECKHNPWDFDRTDYTCVWDDDFADRPQTPDDFCSYGERKESE